MSSTDGGSAKATWDQLAEAFATSRQVSADHLVEWPAQLRLAGDFVGKRVLDVGCGTGEKAAYFAEHGAHSVLGVDPSDGFEQHWQRRRRENLAFASGSFATLAAVAAGRTFDLIVCFQSLMYAKDLTEAVQTMAQLLVPGGRLTLSVPHPFRFAILRNELEGWPLGAAYQRTEAYRYPSPWKPELRLEHAMPKISDYLNAFAKAGLKVLQCEEPGVSAEFRDAAPEKAAWMDRYIGIIVFQMERSGSA